MDYREHADHVREIEPEDPVGAHMLAVCTVPAATAMEAVFKGGAPIEASFRALYSQGMEEALALAEAYPDEARLLLAWIDRHIWPGGMHAGREEAIEGWVAVLR